MTARATAQPSGGDGARVENTLTDQTSSLDAEQIESIRRDGMRYGLSHIELHSLCDSLIALQARLDAAERVVALLREYLPHITTHPLEVETEDEVLQRIRDFQRIKWAMVDELAAYATNPDTGGDDA